MLSGNTVPVPSSGWPRGSYGLVKVRRSGCPSGYGWRTGSRYHDTEDSNSANRWLCYSRDSEQLRFNNLLYLFTSVHLLAVSYDNYCLCDKISVRFLKAFQLPLCLCFTEYQSFNGVTYTNYKTTLLIVDNHLDRLHVISLAALSQMMYMQCLYPSILFLNTSLSFFCTRRKLTTIIYTSDSHCFLPAGHPLCTCLAVGAGTICVGSSACRHTGAAVQVGHEALIAYSPKTAVRVASGEGLCTLMMKIVEIEIATVASCLMVFMAQTPATTSAADVTGAHIQVWHCQHTSRSFCFHTKVGVVRLSEECESDRSGSTGTVRIAQTPTAIRARTLARQGAERTWRSTCVITIVRKNSLIYSLIFHKYF